MIYIILTENLFKNEPLFYDSINFIINSPNDDINKFLHNLKLSLNATHGQSLVLFSCLSLAILVLLIIGYFSLVVFLRELHPIIIPKLKSTRLIKIINTLKKTSFYSLFIYFILAILFQSTLALSLYLLLIS